ncbi:hypothetical protein ZWY2020_022324 [Hordeum vulgare]|nr:hypothetical protein ZWY2020_022324 [Hordeum vulgare]
MASLSPWPENLLAPIVAGLRATCSSWRAVPSLPPPWSDLPQDLLGLIIDGLPDPADRARFSSVCRSWRSAPHPYARQLPWVDAVCRSWYTVSSLGTQLAFVSTRRRFSKPCPPTSQRLPPWRRIFRSAIFPWRQQPWIVLPGGFFLDDIPSELSDHGPEAPTSFPENLQCVGSTDSWLALDCTDGEERHAYFLHNPFSRATVPLPELDAVIGDVSKLFTIHKVLMRSTPDDLIVVMTNNCDLPVFSIQRGKGALLPQPQITNFRTIIDIAFFGDKLWGITKAKELFILPITFEDVPGIPMATSIEQVIWSNIDDADATHDDDDGNNKGYVGDEQNNGEAEKDNDELLFSEEYKAKRRNHSKLMLKARDGMIGTGIQFEPEFMIFRYLVESCGKLLMVIREADSSRFTYKVEVFVLDVNAPAWVPISSCGLGGQTLFISKPFSKSILARGEVEPDAIYFIDFGEVFSMKSSKAIFIGHFREEKFLDYSTTTWVFPPQYN